MSISHYELKCNASLSALHKSRHLLRGSVFVSSYLQYVLRNSKPPRNFMGVLWLFASCQMLPAGRAFSFGVWHGEDIVKVLHNPRCYIITFDGKANLILQTCFAQRFKCVKVLKKLFLAPYDESFVMHRNEFPYP